MMFNNYKRLEKGTTLVEAMVAGVAVALIALGGLAYQYLGASHFRIAHAELTATRAGQLLLEDWKANGAPDLVNYDANDLGVGFAPPAGGVSDYVITVDGITMYFWLSYQDVDSDVSAGITLREIQVKVQWRKDFGSGIVQADDPSLILTTYARLGED